VSKSLNVLPFCVLMALDYQCMFKKLNGGKCPSFYKKQNA